MSSTIFCYFKLMICFGLICTFIQIGNAQPIIIDDDDYQNQIENSFINNYAATINDRLISRIPIEDFYYHKKQFNPDNVQLSKRIIMLPRVGRRSIRST
ncbi:unnamed protein product [Adineta steineri]|uniref:Uncharacterized protein n=1 Tax=Adineta steineri TaxID=433720 RepID=A0A814HVT4_9BILA|nr:unnamed protein product [Adineta steineri]CAF1176184.1 unnamed protein product [Adineta steineri]CAF3854652.1 unnamed protein product [Adineta steineri]CAF3936677.1 unnamed protein product [Adineta steineri]